MNLHERFAELRAEERRAVPRFDAMPRERRRRVAWRMIAVTTTLLLVVIISVTIRPHPTKFSDSDRAAARSVAEWQPPTDFLLRTPGSEMLTSTPRIPDLKGIPR
jgi:hypothetical protein